MAAQHLPAAVGALVVVALSSFVLLSDADDDAEGWWEAVESAGPAAHLRQLLKVQWTGLRPNTTYPFTPMEVNNEIDGTGGPRRHAYSGSSHHPDALPQRSASFALGCWRG